MSSQPDGLITADFITTAHRISGQVQTGSKPLIDVLNAQTSSYVLILNVYFSRLERAGEIGDHAPVAYLSKNNLDLVIVPARQARTPDQVRFSQVEYQALITLSGFEVRGKFTSPRRIDPRAFSPASLDVFIAVTDATAQVTAVPDLTFKGEAILINRQRVQSLCLLESQILAAGR